MLCVEEMLQIEKYFSLLSVPCLGYKHIKNNHQDSLTFKISQTWIDFKMDAIKKKMQSLKSETENSLARAEQLDSEAKEANNKAEKTEELVRFPGNLRSNE